MAAEAPAVGLLQGHGQPPPLEEPRAFFGGCLGVLGLMSKGGWVVRVLYMDKEEAHLPPPSIRVRWPPSSASGSQMAAPVSQKQIMKGINVRHMADGNLPATPQPGAHSLSLCSGTDTSSTTAPASLSLAAAASVVTTTSSSHLFFCLLVCFVNRCENKTQKRK